MFHQFYPSDHGKTFDVEYRDGPDFQARVRKVFGTWVDLEVDPKDRTAEDEDQRGIRRVDQKRIRNATEVRSPIRRYIHRTW